MNHLKNILDGAKQVLVLDPGSDYVRPKRGDFRGDTLNLHSDALRLFKDLRRVTQSHGKQINHRKN